MFWGYTRHGKEKSQKCNQCDFACHNQGNLKVHFRIHNGEKPYHCNQCDFACSKASNLNVHVKTHSGEKSNATSVTIHLPLLVIWKVIWKHTLAKSAINANCATLQPLKLVIWIDTCWRTVVKNLTNATSAHTLPLLKVIYNLKQHLKRCHRWSIFTYSTFKLRDWSAQLVDSVLFLAFEGP